MDDHRRPPRGAVRKGRGKRAGGGTPVHAGRSGATVVGRCGPCGRVRLYRKAGGGVVVDGGGLRSLGAATVTIDLDSTA